MQKCMHYFSVKIWKPKPSFKIGNAEMHATFFSESPAIFSEEMQK